MLEAFTAEARQALVLAREQAVHDGCGMIEDVHLLIGCCRAAGSRAASVLLACGVDPTEVCVRAEARSNALTGKSTGTPPERGPSRGMLILSADALAALNRALEEAAALASPTPGTEHLLLALLGMLTPLGDVLRHSGLQLAEARAAAARLGSSREPKAPRKPGATKRARAAKEPKVPLDPRQFSAVSTRALLLQLASEICVDMGRRPLATQLLELSLQLRHEAESEA